MFANGYTFNAESLISGLAVIVLVLALLGWAVAGVVTILGGRRP